MAQNRMIQKNDNDAIGQPLVVMVGSALHFSDPLLKVLRLEFEGVRFKRLSEPAEVLALDESPTVVVLHETVQELTAHIDAIQKGFANCMLAVACSDQAVLQRLNRLCAFPPISLLQMSAQIDLWFSVLRLLLSGHVCIPASMLRGIPADDSPDQPDLASMQLTPRELEVLPLIAQGMQNKTIAARLNLSEHTVKLHIHNIFTKLGVSNRTGAANWYLSQQEGKANVRALETVR